MSYMGWYFSPYLITTDSYWKLSNLSPTSNVMDVITSSGIIGVSTTIFDKPVFKNHWQSSVHRKMHKTSNQKSVQIM